MSARILVVDDEPQIRRVMRATLTAQGYTVSDARSGEEALEKLGQSPQDLVLLDVNMPGQDSRGAPPVSLDCAGRRPAHDHW